MNSRRFTSSAIDAHDRRRLRVQWERRDGHRVVTVFAVGLLTVAFAMAVFGLPPVDLKGPLSHFGITCPACGGTRAARLTAQGELAEAWRYNPLGIIVVAGSVAAVARAAIGVGCRRWANVVSVHLSPRARRVMIAGAVILLILLGIRQQMQADFLLGA